MEPRHLEKLIYVYADETGEVGQLLIQCKRVLRFGADGSGVIHLNALPEPGQMAGPGEVSVNVTIQAEAAIMNDQLRDLVAGNVPCLVGVSGARKEIVVAPASLARCGRSPSELRGKVRFGLARIGWQLKRD